MLMETQDFAEVIGHQKIILWQYDWMPIDLQNESKNHLQSTNYQVNF